MQFAFYGWSSLKIKLKKYQEEHGTCKFSNLMLEAIPQKAKSIITIKPSGKQLHNSPAWTSNREKVCVFSGKIRCNFCPNTTSLLQWQLVNWIWQIGVAVQHFVYKQTNKKIWVTFQKYIYFIRLKGKNCKELCFKGS